MKEKAKYYQLFEQLKKDIFQVLLLQQGQGLADGLAAHGELLGHFVFPGQALAVLVDPLENIFFQLFEQLVIVCLLYTSRCV